jgi:hypothetical protein
MNRDKIKFIFYGSGSTYSLEPLAKYMHSEGYDVLEMNPESVSFPGYEILKDIKNKDTVFLNSCHPLLDIENVIRSTGVIKGKWFAPLEMIEYIKPVKTVYYPHDLNPFFADYEMPWCNLFDLILLPYKNNLFYKLKSECSNVVEIGWIKNNKLLKKIDIKSDIIYFPSNCYYGMGESNRILFFNYIPKIIPIKMANISESRYNKAIELAKEDGYIFLDKSLTIFQLIHNCNLIITNGVSSIVTESALSGIPVAAMLDGVESDESYLRQLPKLDWVFPLRPEEIKDFITKVQKGKITLEKGINSLKEFDFEKAVKEITK